MPSPLQVRSSLLLLALFSACAPKPSTPLSTATTARDRTWLVEDLEATRQGFLESVKGLSEAQLQFKPAPDRWSIAETAEHIALAEQRIFETVVNKVMPSPLTPELRAQLSPDDQRVHRTLVDRSNKRTAPEVLRPTGRFKSIDETVEAFQKSREKTLELARTRDDLRGHALVHPTLGALDGYQWLVLLSAHSGRHTAQILEVKTAPGFPAQ